MATSLTPTMLNFLRRARNVVPRRGYMPIQGRSPVVCKTAAEAVSHVHSGNRVCLHDASATPLRLVQALSDRAGEIRNVEIVGPNPGWQGSPEPFNIEDEAHRLSFRTNLYFVGPPDRLAYRHKYPHPRFNPLSMNEFPQHLQSPDFPIDIALLSVSPPDQHGWCSLSTAVIIARAAADSAKILIAEVNKKMPRTHGNSFVHYSHLDYILETDCDPVQIPSVRPGKVHMEMGKHVASIIPDGACIQAGIGGIPDAALLFLKNHKDLGIHTEMLADGLVDLWKSGAITCRNKKVHPGKITTGFTMGTNKLYHILADNPLFHFDSAAVTNDPWIIAQNPKTVAINSALQVDLSGQVNAESFGTRQFSGIGGQVDFVRGAALSEGGLPIIALESTASKGNVSRIVPALYPGAAVTTPRWEGCIIATEYGVAPLWGLNTRQRASALIKIAHPKFREELAKQAAEMFGYE